MRIYPDRSYKGVLLLSLIMCLFHLSIGGRAAFSQLPAAVGIGKNSSKPQPATSNSSIETPDQPALPPDPLGRISPRGCVLGFLRAAETKDYRKAAQYLDGKRSEPQAEELAKQLKYLLDRGLSNSTELSRSINGNIDDQLRPSRESIGTIKEPKGELEVMLDLVKHPGGPSVWLFSQQTLNQVPKFYANVQHTNYEHYFPAWTNQLRFLSVPLWRWGLILLALAAILVISSLLTNTVLWLLKNVFRKRLTVKTQASIGKLKSPMFWLLLALMSRFAGGYAITALGRHHWKNVAFLAGCMSASWLLLRMTDILVGYLNHRLLLRTKVEQATFTTLLGRLFKILVGLLLVIVLLTHAGINVSALVAGFGIGGIALAFAAQKTLADLFGGLSIVLRGAVRVGDFCRIDGIVGTVEDIGISALTLRTLDRSVVSLPNAKVAETGLKNFSLRDQFWIHQILTLRFDTSHSVVKSVLKSILEILSSHPNIDKQSARANLLKLTPTGPEIEIFAYFRKPGTDWNAFLAQQEEVILKIMGAVDASGASLAAPPRIIKIVQDDGIDVKFQ